MEFIISDGNKDVIYIADIQKTFREYKNYNNDTFYPKWLTVFSLFPAHVKHI